VLRSQEIVILVQFPNLCAVIDFQRTVNFLNVKDMYNITLQNTELEKRKLYSCYVSC
jgi:hypothetical protein